MLPLPIRRLGDRPQNIGFDGYIRDLGRAGVPAVAALDADLDVVIVEDALDVAGVAFGVRAGAILLPDHGKVDSLVLVDLEKP